MDEQNAIIKNNENSNKDLKEQELLRLMKKSSEKSAREIIKYQDAIKYKILPLSVVKNDGKDLVTVATIQRLSKESKEELKFITNYEIKDILVKSEDFDNVIFSIYHSDDEIIKDSVEKLLVLNNKNDKERNSDNFFNSVKNNEGKFLEDIIKYTISIGASDLHIIPTQKATDIKLRVNREFMFLNNIKILKAQHETIIRRIKVLSNLRLDKQDLPQDGSFIIPELKNLSIRVSIMPTIFGEKAVLRFHNYKTSDDIFELGINDRALIMLKKFLDCKGGAMLCAGPTGSGKTTTIYAMINYLKNKGLNIITLEDPVELAIEGISQTSLNPKNGFDYKDALPAVLRQDPDVIMIGEIRDEISANYLFQAVFSGHKVISTIHAGNIIEIFLRLKSLNINTINMAQALKFLSYQELLPRICKKCMVRNKEDSELLKFDVFSSNGCGDCNDTGNDGKILAIECLSIDDSIKQILLNKDNFSYEDFKNNKNFYSFKNYTFDLLKESKISSETFKRSYQDY